MGRLTDEYGRAGSELLVFLEELAETYQERSHIPLPREALLKRLGPIRARIEEAKKELHTKLDSIFEERANDRKPESETPEP